MPRKRPSVPPMLPERREMIFDLCSFYLFMEFSVIERALFTEQKTFQVYRFGMMENYKSMGGSLNSLNKLVRLDATTWEYSVKERSRKKIDTER